MSNCRLFLILYTCLAPESHHHILIQKSVPLQESICRDCQSVLDDLWLTSCLFIKSIEALTLHLLVLVSSPGKLFFSLMIWLVDFPLPILLCTRVISRRPCLECHMLPKVVPLLVLQFVMLTDLVLDDQLFDFKWQRIFVSPFVLQNFDSILILYSFRNIMVMHVFSKHPFQPNVSFHKFFSLYYVKNKS